MPLFGLLALATMALSGGAAHAQQAAQKPQCFRSSDWGGWKATPDANAMYIRVGGGRIFRIDFAHGCAALHHGGHLVNKVRGSGLICQPIDLDLRVSFGRRMSTACIASKLTQLTPEEVAALPKRLTP
jgi:hypothetical protein